MKTQRNLSFYFRHNYYRGCAITFYFSTSLLATKKLLSTWQKLFSRSTVTFYRGLRRNVREPFIFSYLLKIAVNCANGKNITLTKLW